MKIHKITYPDINNGVGCRVTLWVSGCIHHCRGCQNKETWDFNSGREFTDKDKDILYEVLSKPFIKGLTLSGGDPLCSYKEVLDLVKDVKKKFPQKDIWLYTGYTMDIIKANFSEILEYCDCVVDGPYIESLRDITLAWRGSSNQGLWMKEKNEWINKANDEL